MTTVLAELSEALAQTVESAGPALVRVEGRRRLPATGIVWSADGLVITANHVVRDRKEVQLKTRSGQVIEAKVVRVNPERDVALLSTSRNHNACLPLEPDQPKVGDDIWGLGAPAGEELAFSVSRGIVSALRELDEMQFIQTDASISPGHSGGPLLDEAARVNGMISWKIPLPGFEGLAFGVPIDLVLESLGLVPAEKTDFAGLNKQPEAEDKK